MRTVLFLFLFLVLPFSSLVHAQPPDCYPFNCPKSPGPPLVGTEPATDISSGGATLNGYVNPALSPTMVWFEWSTDPTLARFDQTPDQSAGAGGNTTLMSFDLAGLPANTDIYFRIAARNGYGTARGQIGFLRAAP